MTTLERIAFACLVVLATTVGACLSGGVTP